MVLSLYLIGYVHSSNSYCEGGPIDGDYTEDNLDAAISECNTNIECNCLCTCYEGNEYGLFKGTTTYSHSYYESWVG